MILNLFPKSPVLLKFKDDMYDITTVNQMPRTEIISEIEIAPLQIGSFKKRYHLNYIENWLQIEKMYKHSVREIWQIREECMQVISEKCSRQALCCA